MLYSKFVVYEGHEPSRTNHQILQVLEEGRLLTFNTVSVELANPCQNEYNDGGLPQWRVPIPQVRLIGIADTNTEETPGHHPYSQRNRQTYVEQENRYQHQSS